LITVFVADDCPHCEALLADLSRRRVAYRCVNLNGDPRALVELAAVTRERCVPIVVDHEVCSVGFAGRATTLAELGLA
jgi:glutaredoxin